MGIPVIFNKKGFTLIEFLVAIVILMVGLLGLLQTVNYALSHNLTNQLRQGALQIANDELKLEKAKPFDLVSSAVSPGLIQNKTAAHMINGTFRNYSVTKTGMQDRATEPRIKHVEVQVTWRHKQERFVHSIASMVSRFE